MKRYLLLLIPICSLCLLNACGGSSAPPVVPPSITTTEAQVMAVPAIVGSPYKFIFQAMSGGGAGDPGPYTWQAVGLPASGLSLDPTSGTVSGTPTSKGSVAFSLTNTDGAGHSSAAVPFTITVNNPPPPTINTTPPPTVGVENHAYSFTFTATAGYPPLAWTETGALPAGLAFSTAGVISGTPTVIGSFPIAVSAQDTHGETAGPQNFTIQVLLGLMQRGVWKRRATTIPRRYSTPAKCS